MILNNLNNIYDKIKILNLTSSQCVDCSETFSKKDSPKKIPCDLQRRCFFNGYIITDNCSWHSKCTDKFSSWLDSNCRNVVDKKDKTQQFINHYKDKFEIYHAKKIQLVLNYKNVKRLH